MYSSDYNNNIHISFCAYAVTAMDVRVGQPVEALRQLGANVQLNENALKFISNVPREEPKVLVLQRSFLSKTDWPKAVKSCIEKDWLFVVEYDDYPENPFNAAKRAASLDWVRFQMCHGVQCSTKPLADAFLAHNSEVALFENQLMRMPAPVPKSQDSIRVFFGALNRKNAWKPLIKVYNKIIAEHPEIEPIILFDKEFFDAIESPKKKFSPLVQYDEYLRIINSCDIVLTPLDDTVFNQYKSDIKFLEASSGGAAMIASPTVYADTIRHEQTGLIARTPKEWENGFRRLVKDKNFREMLGRNAKHYVTSSRMLMQHAHKRVEWYQHLWKNRHMINERLFKDFPELKP
ncbi:hypothetical protein KFE96_08290 [Kordiimonas sp. SCSIO 12603]|uniref:glycosyltransferase family protein n=1 Tax=Kordiimonas sp. SCSIO 12603 TaxID=2829596 RepID=UPI002102CCB2|nr:hypothetical protein [Kordiimonas sp. SCSIO 12603]UTW60301.1 hypothetical protein KFE96_08290 [Kordiimonas sp. SCSIO 12603]